jgi:hypothetical protein
MGLVAASLGPAWRHRQTRGPRGQKSDFGSVPDPGTPRPEVRLRSVPDPGPRGPAVRRPSDEAAAGPTRRCRPRPGRQDPEDLASEFLTVDAAKRAIDAFAEVRDKYNDEGIENYNSLEAFVAETEAGKRLEADIMAHGFSDITDWNVTIMAVGFAYSAIVYDYAADLRQQIEAVRTTAPRRGDARPGSSPGSPR